MGEPHGAIPLRERRTLADEWKEFGVQVVPNGAPDVQRVEMQKAFYAGATIMFSLLTGGLDPHAEPTELDVAYVESLHQELQAFVKSLQE